MTKEKLDAFNRGMLFGIAQCLANQCPDICAINALKAAGVSRAEIISAKLDEYDMRQFETILDALEG